MKGSRRGAVGDMNGGGGVACIDRKKSEGVSEEQEEGGRMKIARRRPGMTRKS